MTALSPAGGRVGTIAFRQAKATANFEHQRDRGRSQPDATKDKVRAET